MTGRNVMSNSRGLRDLYLIFETAGYFQVILS